MAIMYRGIVKKLNDTSAHVLIPALSGVHWYRYLDNHSTVPLQLEDDVIVGTVGEVLEDLVILGKLTPVVTEGPEQMPVYFFEDVAARDVIFPDPLTIGVLVWIDDLQELQVYSLLEDDWVSVTSWDEVRITAIEGDITSLQTDVGNLFLTALSHDTRLDTAEADINTLQTDLDTLEANAVTAVGPGFGSININKVGNTISADVVPNTVPLNDLSDVIISGGGPFAGEHIRHNGTNWVNLLPLFDDPSDVDTTGKQTGDDIRYNGTNWVATRAPRRMVTGAYYTGGTGITAAGTEVALVAWTGADTHVFEQLQIYRWTLAYGIADSNGVTHLADMRIRKNVNSTAGQLLGRWRAVTSPNMGNFPYNQVRSGYIKNASGAQVSTAIGVTAQRTAAGGTAANVLIYGDADYPMYLEIEHIGREADHPRFSSIAVEIA